MLGGKTLKYPYTEEVIPQNRRMEVNEKILFLIDSNTADTHHILPEDIFQAYTGDGGLHSLTPNDFNNYHEYSHAKKEFENGQFFTPPALCELIISSLKLSSRDLIADLTCGMGRFFNFVPVESNAYGCELDIRAYKVAHFLFPDANIECRDLRTYQPAVRFDYVVGNPPSIWTGGPNPMENCPLKCTTA